MACVCMVRGEWYNEVCSFEAYSVCDVTKKVQHTTEKGERELIIRGFSLKWQLVYSDYPKEKAKKDKDKQALWKTKDKQDIRGTNWILMLIVSFLQKSQRANFQENVVGKAILEQR